MPSSTSIRVQVELALSQKFPSALTPPVRMVRPVVATGIGPLDALLEGGLPIGAMTELVGKECSGRTSVALSFLSRITASGKVCAWIDASNSFNPASAASIGVDLRRLLWVRCGVQETPSVQETKQVTLPKSCLTPKPITKGLHGGGHGTHPRSEVKGLSTAIDRFLNTHTTATQPLTPVSAGSPRQKSREEAAPSPAPMKSLRQRARAYDAIEQALRSADLLIQTGGFSAIVLDLGGIPAKYAARVELSTWHRYRVASEQTQSSIVLLSQYPCAKSSSELQLQLLPMENTREERTVFTGLNARVEILRQRFTETATNVVSIRKPPQRIREACWSHRASWVGPR